MDGILDFVVKNPALVGLVAIGLIIQAVQLILKSRGVDVQQESIFNGMVLDLQKRVAKLEDEKDKSQQALRDKDIEIIRLTTLWDSERETVKKLETKIAELDERVRKLEDERSDLEHQVKILTTERDEARDTLREALKQLEKLQSKPAK